MVVESTITRIVEFSFLAAVFLLNALVLDARYENILLAVSGSLAGALMLTYYRREKIKAEMAFKVLASAMGGIVFGSVAQAYFEITHPSYLLGLFFISSILSIALIKAVLNFTDQNASEFIKTVVHRMFGFEVKSVKEKKRNEKYLEDDDKNGIANDSDGRRGL